MLIKTLAIVVIVVIVVVFLLIVGALERRREKALRDWVSRHPGARLFWPFASAEHPELPIGQLIERLDGHLPLSLASAVLVRQADGDVWWVEYRATPAALKSSQWFTLMAKQCGDHAAALCCEEELKRTVPDGATMTHHSWVFQRHQGLLTVERLELRTVEQ